MSQIFFFTGENAYALGLEKKRWMDQFRDKHGPENLIRLDAAGLSFGAFLDEAASAPFIAEKRLIVLQGTPKFLKEETLSIPEHLHPDAVLLIADGKPDKRLSAVKELQKFSTLKEFPLLDRKALDAWIDQHAKSLGTSIAPPARAHLVAIVGEDQEMLASELTKLTLAATGRAITSEDIDMLAMPSGEQEVWTLTNLLSAGKKREALAYARSLQERGTTAQSLWAILLWMLENLTLVAAAAAANERNPGKIASQLGVPFPSVRTLMPLASVIDPVALRSFVSQVVSDDIELKTGGYRATAEAPEELVALIDRFILRCGSLVRK
ncbi:DNA polymerase III subunit delta [Candidatus Peregrinibacteria bacterium]|nr:DNA polymerase III subunit delta [Candidatus Peregrinibacteria bacterium]